MAITINWGTKVIEVPQSFLTPLGGTNYSLNTTDFFRAIRDLEDDEAGAPFPQVIRHNTEVALGGIQYARVLEIINGYTVTFEDVGSPYAVSLLGSNNNILDVTNLNNVAIRSSNSAGLIGLEGPAAIAAAVLAAAQATPIDANIKQVNDTAITGAGTEADPWGP